MMNIKDNIKNIEIVLDGLGKYKDDVIFIGGACTQFYVDHSNIHDARETFDVDLIINITSPIQYSILND